MSSRVGISDSRIYRRKETTVERAPLQMFRKIVITVKLVYNDLGFKENPVITNKIIEYGWPNILD